jgi:branched-chain amino acid transport system permease protein
MPGSTLARVFLFGMVIIAHSGLPEDQAGDYRTLQLLPGAERSYETLDVMQVFASVLIDGLVYASYLFMVSAGLTITFGVLRVLNVAHGTFYALGAYGAAAAIGAASLTDLHPVLFFVLMPITSFAVACVLGLLVERGVLRRLYGRDEVTAALATFGIMLVLEDAIPLIFGVQPYFAPQPLVLLGTVDIGGVTRDVYSLGVIGLAAAVGALLWLLMTRTRWGTSITAVVHDREIGTAMGIDVKLIFTITFLLGSFLAALSGAVVAPLIAVSPGLGVQIIVVSFAVIVIGGMGSIPGAMIGALLIGLVRAVMIHYAPVAEAFTIYAVMTLSLIVRPQGLFVIAGVRRI